LRARNPHVAEVAHLVAQLRDALIEPRHAQRRRAYVHAREAGAEAERDAQDAHAPPRAGAIRRKTLRLLSS
jgi:hypothetical protein